MSENANKKAPKQLPKPVRWTVQAGAMDFAIDEKTLASRLNRAGTLPGKDKRYSTAQIAAAVFGDLRQAQTRLASAQADAAETELARLRGEVVPVAAAFQVVSNMLFSVRRIVLMSPLPREAQDAVLKELAGLDVKEFVTETTATKGTK